MHKRIFQLLKILTQGVISRMQNLACLFIGGVFSIPGDGEWVMQQRKYHCKKLYTADGFF